MEHSGKEFTWNNKHSPGNLPGERSKSLWPKVTRSMVKEPTGQAILREILIIHIGASPMELRSTDRYHYQAIPFEASQHEVSTNNQKNNQRFPTPPIQNKLMAKKTNHLSGMLCTIHLAWLTANHQQKQKHQPASSKWPFFWSPKWRSRFTPEKKTHTHFLKHPKKVTCQNLAPTKKIIKQLISKTASINAHDGSMYGI